LSGKQEERDTGQEKEGLMGLGKGEGSPGGGDRSVTTRVKRGGSGNKREERTLEPRVVREESEGRGVREKDRGGGWLHFKRQGGVGGKGIVNRREVEGNIGRRKEVSLTRIKILAGGRKKKGRQKGKVIRAKMDWGKEREFNDETEKKP